LLEGDETAGKESEENREKGMGKRTLHEEIPEAYKAVDEVVDVVHRAGLSKRVARLRAVGCIKG